MKLSKRGQSNEERKILPSKKGGAGGVLARTIGRALSNLHPPMVAGWGLLCRHFGGVRIMKEHTDWDTCLVWECGKCEQEGESWVKKNKAVSK